MLLIFSVPCFDILFFDIVERVCSLLLPGALPKLIRMRFSLTAAVAATASLLFSSFASAQLSGSVGPITSTASKASKKICNVLSYGAKADKSTDIGPPLASAFAACKSGGIGMSTW